MLHHERVMPTDAHTSHGPRSRSQRLAIGLCLACAVWGTSTPARAQEDEPVEAERLEHALAYLAADYAMAAIRGVADDDDEHEEHAKLADQIQRMASRLPLPPELATRIADVKLLIRRVAPESDVSGAIDDIRARLIATLRIPVSPKVPPNAAHGKALFEQYCASCHGTTGRGDTDRAASLKPRPANFLDPMVGEALSPYRITTTIRFGIDGTAMVPFGFLGDADRWDLAFYALGLRHVAPLADEGPLYNVSELARLSDADVRADLRAGGVSEALVEPTLTELRRRAPYEDWSRHDSLAVARAELEQARDAIERGDRESALLAARNAEAKGFVPAEAAIRRLDSTLARNAHKALASVAAQIEAGASATEVRASVGIALRSTLRAERASWHAYGRPTSFAKAVETAWQLVELGAEALVLLVTLLLVLTRSGPARGKRSVHVGWIVALPLGLATSTFLRQLQPIPSAARDAFESTLSLLVGCGLLYLAWLFFSPRGALRGPRVPDQGLARKTAAGVLFAVAFVASYRAAFAASALVAAWRACSVATGPVALGTASGVAALALFALACTRAIRLAPPRVFMGIAGSLLFGQSALFLGQGLVALYSLATHR